MLSKIKKTRRGNRGLSAKAISIKPDLLRPFTITWATLSKNQGKLEEAIEAFRQSTFYQA